MHIRHKTRGEQHEILCAVLRPVERKLSGNYNEPKNFPVVKRRRWPLVAAVLANRERRALFAGSLQLKHGMRSGGYSSTGRRRVTI